MSLAPLRYRAGSPARRSAPTGAAPCPCAIEPRTLPGMRSPTAHHISAREAARRRTGQFGHQHHAESALTLRPTGAKMPNTQRARQRADELIAFHDEHGRMPRKSSDDVHERGLAQWRHRAKSNPDWDVADYLDEHLDGWREANPLTGSRIAMEKAEALIDFQRTRHTNPSIDSPDAAERELASWVNNTANLKENPTAQKILSQSLPGWTNRSANRERLDRHHCAKAEDFINFVDENGHYPHHLSDSAHERALSQWRRIQMSGNTNSAAKAIMDEALPGWDKSRGHTGSSDIVRAQLVVEFYTEHGRIPSRDGGPAQRELHDWMHDYVERSHPDHQARLLLDEHLVPWSDPD